MPKRLEDLCNRYTKVSSQALLIVPIEMMMIEVNSDDAKALLFDPDETTLLLLIEEAPQNRLRFTGLQLDKVISISTYLAILLLHTLSLVWLNLTMVLSLLPPLPKPPNMLP